MYITNHIPLASLHWAWRQTMRSLKLPAHSSALNCPYWTAHAPWCVKYLLCAGAGRSLTVGAGVWQGLLGDIDGAASESHLTPAPAPDESRDMWTTPLPAALAGLELGGSPDDDHRLHGAELDADADAVPPTAVTPCFFSPPSEQPLTSLQMHTHSCRIHHGCYACLLLACSIHVLRALTGGPSFWAFDKVPLAERRGGFADGRSSVGRDRSPSLASIWSGTPGRGSDEERARLREAHADALASEYERSAGSGYEQVRLRTPVQIWQYAACRKSTAPDLGQVRQGHRVIF